MRKSLIILFSLLFLFVSVFTGCDQKVIQYGETVNGIADVVVHSELSSNIVYKEIPIESKQRNMQRGIGFVRAEDIDTYQYQRPQNDEFRLKNNEKFAPYLILGNGLQESVVVLVTAIVDYKQVNFKLDGKEGLLHEVTLSPDCEINLPFELDVSGSGAHDIQVVAFYDPYNKTTDINYHMSFNTHALGDRTVVIVGEEDIPVRTLPATIKGTPIPSDANFDMEISFAYLPDDGTRASDRQLYIVEATAGSTYSFQMYNSNYGKNRSVIQAMIPFLDYHQIQVNGSDIIVAELAPGEEALTNIDLQMADEPDVHQFQLIYLFDPYKSELRMETFDPFVIGSFRIAIDAK